MAYGSFISFLPGSQHIKSSSKHSSIPHQSLKNCAFQRFFFGNVECYNREEVEYYNVHRRRNTLENVNLPDKKRFHEILKIERARRGWSQAYVAEQLGTDFRVISRWERGIHQPTAFHRPKLCALFGITPEEFGLTSIDVVQPPPVTNPVPAPILPEEPASSEVPVEEIVSSPAPLPAPAEKRRLPSRIHAAQLFFRKTSVRVASILLLATLIVSTILFFSKQLSGAGTQPVVFSTHDAPPAPYPPYHKVSVNNVSWSPNGRYLECAYGNSTVEVIDAHTGKHVLTYQGHQSFVNNASWSPDSGYIASASADKTVQIWNAQSGQLIKTLPHEGSVFIVNWSPGGKLLASAGADGDVRVWNVLTGKLVKSYKADSMGIWALDWSPDGRYLISGGFDKRVQIWDTTTDKLVKTYTLNNATIYDARWSPDGKFIASSDGNGNVQVWSGLSGRWQFTYKGHQLAVHVAKWSPNGKRIASGSEDGTIQVWDAFTGQHAYTYRGQKDKVYDLSWSPDGRQIASASKDGTVQVWTPQA
jgi:transcriptional regulator with XRE-family HTH domain/Tol biopolymer transport system component